MSPKPRLSIISPSFNSAPFIKDTIESVMSQSFKDWEHIVVDGASTDGSLEIFKQYPHLKAISEKDHGVDDAYAKGLAVAQGDYVTLCCLSDGYVNENWYKMGVEFLDQHPEYSLVWGVDQLMSEDGNLIEIPYNHFFKNPPASGKEYIYYWFKDFTMFHERDMIVRKEVMQKCCPSYYPGMMEKESGQITFMYNFNVQGYLSYFMPVVAAYGRVQKNNLSLNWKQRGIYDRHINKYFSDCRAFKKEVLSGTKKFVYRDGLGNVLAENFDRQRFLGEERREGFKKLLLSILPPFIIYGIRATLRELRRLFQKKV